jgi:molybdopterin converting factor small subunit
LKEKMGRDALEVAIELPLSGSDLLDHLARAYPEIAPYRPVIRLAVNEVYVREQIELKSGDEVALITPVSGG